MESYGNEKERMPQTNLPMHFRFLLLATAFLALALCTEWSAFINLWLQSVTYNHGFMVLASVLFLLFVRREALTRLRMQGSTPALICLASAIGCLVIVQTANIRVLQLLATPFIIILWGWSIWGRNFARVAGGPILLLLFAAPFWDEFSPILQLATVFVNEHLLSLVGIPADIKEFYIQLSVGTFVVESGCSGIRYLIVGLFLASFYSQLFYRSWRKTAALVLIAAFLSIFANWVRVFGIILAGHYTDMKTSLVHEHELFGWLVYLVVALIPLLIVAGKLDHREQPKYLNVSESSSHKSGDRNSIHYRFLVVASLFALLPTIFPLVLAETLSDTASHWKPELPSVRTGWNGPLKYADFWHPEFHDPDYDMSGVYVSDKLERVQVQFIGYRHQRQGKELIYYENSLFDPSQWEQESQRVVNVPKNNVQGLDTATETVILNEKTGSRVIIWSWFQVADHIDTSPLMIKLVGAIKQLTGDGRAALWAVAAECNATDSTDCGPQRAYLERFLSAIASDQ